MEKILSLAKQILDNNPDAILTGSLMLHIRGIDLNRDVTDIDILLGDYAYNFNKPNDMYFENIGTGSDVYFSRYKYNDIIIDIMGGSEDFDIIDNGFRIAKVENLIKKKITYSKQDNDKAEKHKNDLTILNQIYGYNIDDNDLPF